MTRATAGGVVGGVRGWARAAAATRPWALSAALALGTGCRDAAPPRIGVVLGSEATYSARLAMETLHAAPEADRREIALVNMAGRYNSDATAALSAAESLSTMPGLLAVVGHSNSGASIAASQVYNARHVVQVAPTSTSPLYGQAGPYSFRLVGSDEGQARFLAERIAEAGAARVAIMHVNDDYGRALHQLVLRELGARRIVPRYDGSYVETEPLPVGETVDAIAAARPTLLVWLGRVHHFALLADTLHGRLPGLPVLASDGFDSPELRGDTLHRFDGIRHVRLVDLSHGSPALASLRARYRAMGAGELTDQAALSYDAILLLAQGIHEAGRDREAIRRWLTRLGRDLPAYPGVTGPIAFDSTGGRVGGYALVTVGAPLAGRGR